MSTPEEKISALVKTQAGLKAYITVCMKNLNALDVDDLKIHFKARKGTILNYLQKVQKVDESIIEAYDQGDESVEERKLAEITSQIGVCGQFPGGQFPCRKLRVWTIARLTIAIRTIAISSKIYWIK